MVYKGKRREEEEKRRMVDGQETGKRNQEGAWGVAKAEAG
jgi:hypothetical protein